MSGEAAVACLLDCNLNDSEHDGQILDLRVFERPLATIVYNADLSREPRKGNWRRVAVNFHRQIFSGPAHLEYSSLQNRGRVSAWL